MENGQGDTDNDGLSDYDEMMAGTHPNKADTDEDGLNDGDEVNVHQTDPNKADTDGDSLNDFVEITTHKTSPLLTDTDGDTMPDDWEVYYELDPLSDDSGLDSDGDSLTNLAEFKEHSHPQVPEVLDKGNNNDIAAAQAVDGAFNTAFSPDIGDINSNTSQTLPHATVLGKGDGENDVDYYAFTVTGKDSQVILDIDFKAGSDKHFDTYLELYNSDGTLIFNNDDANWHTDGQGGSTSIYDSYLELTLQPGTYYVKVSAYGTEAIAEGSAYQLHVTVEGVQVANWRKD